MALGDAGDLKPYSVQQLRGGGAKGERERRRGEGGRGRRDRQGRGKRGRGRERQEGREGEEGKGGGGAGGFFSHHQEAPASFPSAQAEAPHRQQKALSSVLKVRRLMSPSVWVCLCVCLRLH